MLNERIYRENKECVHILTITKNSELFNNFIIVTSLLEVDLECHIHHFQKNSHLQNVSIHIKFHW